MNYREFLIAGIFAQTVVFGATYTGAGLAEDMKKGIIDRFRSLPMTRSAVLLGRTGSDIIYNVLSITIMALTGLLVGWRIRTSFWEAAAGFGLLLLFSYAFSWVMAAWDLMVPSPEVVNNASFMVIMPLTFISNAFVPSESLPGPLRVFAEWNPVSAVTQGARNLFGNVNPLAPTSRGLVDAEPRALHPDLDRRDPVRVRPVLDPPLQAGRQEVAQFTAPPTGARRDAAGTCADPRLSPKALPTRGRTAPCRSRSGRR